MLAAVDLSEASANAIQNGDRAGVMNGSVPFEGADGPRWNEVRKDRQTRSFGANAGRDALDLFLRTRLP